MNLLLDTHILIWSLLESQRLSKKALELLQNPENQIFYSIVSIWEIAIKNNTRKKPMNFSAEQILETCAKFGYEKISLEDSHILYLKNLRRKADAPPHKDPFDMMLISQAATKEETALLTHDYLLRDYEGEGVWIIHV